MPLSTRKSFLLSDPFCCYALSVGTELLSWTLVSRGTRAGGPACDPQTGAQREASGCRGPELRMEEAGWAPREAGAKAESLLLLEEAGDTDLDGVHDLGVLSATVRTMEWSSASCPTPVWASLGCGFSLIGAFDSLVHRKVQAGLSLGSRLAVCGIPPAACLPKR